MLANATGRLAELEAMLFIVLLETHDDSDRYKIFSDLAQQAMGLPKVCVSFQAELTFITFSYFSSKEFS